MNQPWDHVPAWAAEFPNDNPALHEGVSWVCFSVCSPPKPLARPRVLRRALAPDAPPVSIAAHPTSTVVAETAAIAAPVAANESSVPIVERAPGTRLPASVLRVLLERLDFELTPPAGAVDVAAPAVSPISEPLDLDASDLEPAAVIDAAGEPVAAGLDAAPSVGEATTQANLGVAAAELGAERAWLEQGVGAPLECGGETIHDGSPQFVDSEESHDVAPPQLVGPSADGQDEIVFDGALDAEGSERSPDTVATHVPEIVTMTAAVTIDGQAPAASSSPTPAPESAKSEAFRAFVAALVEVLLAAGATRAAAVLPGVLQASDADTSALDAESQRLLVGAGVAEENDGRAFLRSNFLATARAWRDVLSGDINDLSACGTTTLDGWAGDLLKGFGVGRDGRTDVRRELRRRGVAAFGMLLAA